jgi:hypothetical protein
VVLVAATVMLLGGASPAIAAERGPAAGPVVAVGPAVEPGPDPTASPDPIAHDPTLIKQGGYYYEIITGDIGTRTYLPIRRSADLVHWEFLGTVFATPPAWVVEELGTTPGDFWAPDVNFFDGEYHLYYAASVFGRNTSVIGLATNATLDPDSPRYEWVDRGMVIRSFETDDFNAIDADVVFEPGGAAWLSFGSFWDGIRMRRLDPETGLLSTADPTLYSLASRGGASIEGPSIVRHGRYYYLFVSFDFCCRGVNSDYRVVVGRSTAVTGPYVDAAGVPMLSGGGTELLRGYNGFRGTGGGDVFSARGPGGRAELFVHHYYDAVDAALPKGSVRPVSWVDGWPVLGRPLSGNRGFGTGGAYVTVVNRDSGAAVANAGCGYEGADIRLAAVAPGDACQQWRLEDRGGGYASILNRHSNKVAEVAACVNADGARVAQWGWLDNDCQKFRLVATDSGWSRVENKLAGRVLDAASCGGEGAAIQVFTWLGNDCQQFRLDPVGDVLLADGANRRLVGTSECRRHGGGRGAAIAVLDGRRTGDCQLWRFVHAEEGYFTVVNKQTGRALVAGAGGRVMLGGRADRADARAQWRIEALNNGAYRLVSRAGRAVRLDAGVRHASPDGTPAEELLLLTP